MTKLVSHQAVIWTWQSGSRIFILNHYDKLPPVMKDKRMCVNGRTEGFLDWNRIQSNPCPGDSWPAAVLFPNACGLLYLPSRLHTASEWSSHNANLILPLSSNLPSVPWCPQDKCSHPRLTLRPSVVCVHLHLSPHLPLNSASDHVVMWVSPVAFLTGEITELLWELNEIINIKCSEQSLQCITAQ